MTWRLPMPDETLATKTVTELCDHAGVPFAEPFSLAEVVAILRACEYAVDADLITGLLAHNRIPAPPGGQWDAPHFHVLTAFLEGHRLWMPGSTLHRRKKSAARLELEQLQAAGESMPGAVHGVLGLLTLLVQANHRDEREAAFELVLHRLRSLGVDLHA